MKKYFPYLCFFLSPIALSAQYLTGIATYYSDSFIEWQLYTDVEEEVGELRLQWEDDWGKWDYRLNERSGTIKLKWRDRPDEWELRGNGKIVHARTIWNGDFTEWRITEGGQVFTLQSKWKNVFDDWNLRNSKLGNFDVQTFRERDPRDWNIFDEMDEEVSFETKLMIVFLVVYRSTPKQ